MIANVNVAQIKKDLADATLSDAALARKYDVARATIAHWRNIYGVKRTRATAPRRDEILHMLAKYPLGVEGRQLWRLANVSRQDASKRMKVLERIGRAVRRVINRQVHLWFLPEHVGAFDASTWVNTALARCRHCGERAAYRKGKRNGTQQYKCTKCGTYSSVAPGEVHATEVGASRHTATVAMHA
jgi:DNA-directed RNA polymerase subunit RPC12/RpoP